MRDNTLSTVIPTPSGNAGTPVPPADPSFQAALDNIWPCFDVPGATVDARSDVPGANTVDATMVCLWEFVSKSSKKLDSALHSFCQEQLEHNTRVDSILQDIRADHLDPDSFVTTQEFDHRVTPVLDTVAPLPAAITALEAKFDTMFSNFHTAFLSGFTTSLAQLESTMASSVHSSLVDVVASNHTLVTTVDKLDSHVSSFEDRLTAVESTVKKVDHSTTTMVARLQDMGTSLTLFMAQPPLPQDFSPVTATLGSAAEGATGSWSLADGPPLNDANGAVGGSSQPPDTIPSAPWASTPGTRWTNVDPTSFSSGDRPPPLRAHPKVDTSSSDPGDADYPHTPCTIEGRRCQAIKDGLSRFDFAALCDPHYHGGRDGLPTLTIGDIRERGYTSINTDDVVLCFNDIISLHSKVLSSWTNLHYLQSGPTIDRIVEKAVPTILPKLEGLLAAELVSWYDNLQKFSSVYLLPFMPFDAINLWLGFEGLYPPGLDCSCYADMPGYDGSLPSAFT